MGKAVSFSEKATDRKPVLRGYGRDAKKRASAVADSDTVKIKSTWACYGVIQTKQPNYYPNETALHMLMLHLQTASIRVYPALKSSS